MLISAIVLGIIIGLFRGGRLSNLSSIKFKFLNLFFVGFLIQLIPFFLGKFELFAKNAIYINFLGYVIVVLFLLLNIKKKGFIFLFFGGFLNIICLVINSFRMPIIFEGTSSGTIQLKLAVLSGQVSNYVPIESAKTPGDFLGKIITMPDWYIGVPAIGISDILIIIGVVILVQNEINTRRGFFV